MKREDVIHMIQKELEENPEIKSIDISRKYRIPLKIVELVRRKTEQKNKK